MSSPLKINKLSDKNINYLVTDSSTGKKSIPGEYTITQLETEEIDFFSPTPTNEQIYKMYEKYGRYNKIEYEDLTPEEKRIIISVLKNSDYTGSIHTIKNIEYKKLPEDETGKCQLIISTSEGIEISCLLDISSTRSILGNPYVSYHNLTTSASEKEIYRSYKKYGKGDKINYENLTEKEKASINNLLENNGQEEECYNIESIKYGKMPIDEEGLTRLTIKTNDGIEYNYCLDTTDTLPEVRYGGVYYGNMTYQAATKEMNTMYEKNGRGNKMDYASLSDKEKEATLKVMEYNGNPNQINNVESINFGKMPIDEEGLTRLTIKTNDGIEHNYFINNKKGSPIIGKVWESEN